jgi:hypothetical protein
LLLPQLAESIKLGLNLIRILPCAVCLANKNITKLPSSINRAKKLSPIPMRQGVIPLKKPLNNPVSEPKNTRSAEIRLISLRTGPGGAKSSPLFRD